VRLSGPSALAATASVFAGPEGVDPGRRSLAEGEVRLPGVAAPLPADLYLWQAPHSYTGQDMAELQTARGRRHVQETLTKAIVKAYTEDGKEAVIDVYYPEFVSQ
jgi:tRNA U34 5-carboxymethylaminomethyl modifying GTPase MnmE/TrmE